MNDELQENSRENELELREEVDMAKQHVLETQRKMDAVQEGITDYETTITKFRELVTSLQVSVIYIYSETDVSGVAG